MLRPFDRKEHLVFCYVRGGVYGSNGFILAII